MSNWAKVTDERQRESVCRDNARRSDAWADTMEKQGNHEAAQNARDSATRERNEAAQHDQKANEAAKEE